MQLSPTGSVCYKKLLFSCRLRYSHSKSSCPPHTERCSTHTFTLPRSAYSLSHPTDIVLRGQGCTNSSPTTLTLQAFGIGCPRLGTQQSARASAAIQAGRAPSRDAGAFLVVSQGPTCSWLGRSVTAGVRRGLGPRVRQLPERVTRPVHPQHSHTPVCCGQTKRGSVSLRRADSSFLSSQRMSAARYWSLGPSSWQTVWSQRCYAALKYCVKATPPNKLVRPGWPLSGTELFERRKS